ncbi:signal transduction histidine kinase [Kitasatospora sp. MAA4]|uniref:sensor histidine kinase n=1 Tax=Kitasatospora sp. MAA4 TaxID=3035093 RepID=UPI00247DF544|nr:signal transduction histidine kinase [Kitasatospora sp. MAA4]
MITSSTPRDRLGRDTGVAGSAAPTGHSARSGWFRSLARAPWSSAARREAVLAAAGVAIALPVLVMLSTTALVGPMFLLVLSSFGALTAAQRSRFRALGGLDIPRRPAVAGGSRWNPLVRLRSESTWRQASYHFVVGPLLATAGVMVLLGWGAGAALATVFGWAWLMPLGSVVRGPGWTTVDAWATLLGLLLLTLAPWLIGQVNRADRRAATVLLGPNRARELERRVEDLAESRAGVVDAADAERRRIERDLHDGAQQRLVSLAMNLGLARKTLKDVPPDAMRVIIEAHEEAQAAIVELRDLVRGLHPVVLEDRGLDAALSGIAARAPLPVRLDVHLPQRVAPTVEAVAYFVVSEALANVAKHARASRVDLVVRRTGPLLRIVITDDGVGGADPAKGTGLTGLRKRAASVDGVLSIASPLGGPTTITVELPCEL